MLDVGSRFRTWIDDEILYCSNGSHFACIDIKDSDDKVGWNRMKDVEQLVDDLFVSKHGATYSLSREIFLM